VRFRNLVKPTPTVCPPLGKALHWRLISHMALNYVSLSDVKHFKELLRVYDFLSEQDVQHSHTHQRMLDGIISVGSTFAQRMVRGAPLRGSQVRVELNDDCFAGEGDAHLFAAVLDRFFGLYVTLNSYTQLTARFTRTGRVHAFPPRWGDRITPSETRDV
jgi:type VI secretion system protein ImpG